MANNTYVAKINIYATIAEKKNRYGDTETPSEYHNLLEIEVTANTLEKLQEKIHAHVDLVESRES